MLMSIPAAVSLSSLRLA